MWASVVTAGIISLLAGLVAQPPRRYQFWRRWDPVRFGFCIVVYLLCHAALGVLVALFADSAHWQPFDDWFLSGLTYALVGQGIVRVAPQGLSSELTSSQTLLSRFIDFTVKVMDTGCEDRIETKLESLPAEGIAAQATWIYERYVVGDDRLPPEAREVMFEGLAKATDDLEHDSSRLAGRGILERFCIRQFVSRELLPRAIKNTSPKSPRPKSKHHRI